MINTSSLLKFEYKFNNSDIAKSITHKMLILFFIWTLMIIILYIYVLLLTNVERNKQNYISFHNSMKKLILLKTFYVVFFMNYTIVINPLSYITGKVLISSI